MDKRKLLFAIIKEINKGNRAFTHEDFGVDKQLFVETVNLAVRENYIINVFYADDEPFYGTAEVTMKGLDYLEENNGWAKAYRTLKELRDWLRL